MDFDTIVHKIKHCGFICLTPKENYIDETTILEIKCPKCGHIKNMSYEKFRNLSTRYVGCNPHIHFLKTFCEKYEIEFIGEYKNKDTMLHFICKHNQEFDCSFNTFRSIIRILIRHKFEYICAHDIVDLCGMIDGVCTESPENTKNSGIIDRQYMLEYQNSHAATIIYNSKYICPLDTTERLAKILNNSPLSKKSPEQTEFDFKFITDHLKDYGLTCLYTDHSDINITSRFRCQKNHEFECSYREIFNRMKHNCVCIECDYEYE